MFINDLNLQTDAELDLFADDTTLTSSVDFICVNKLSEKLSSEVASVNEWAMKTKSTLLTGKHLKFSSLSEFNITFERTQLKQVNNLKLLGLDIEANLTFRNHVKVLSNKFSRCIGILNKTKSYLPMFSMIKPLIMYCSTLWMCTSKDNINRIFNLQKQCPRIMLNAKPWWIFSISSTGCLFYRNRC